jgi:hypothetical protein
MVLVWGVDSHVARVVPALGAGGSSSRDASSKPRDNEAEKGDRFTAALPKQLRRTNFRPSLIPKNRNEIDLTVDGRPVHLTNLQKVFWPGLGRTKRDLLQ